MKFSLALLVVLAVTFEVNAVPLNKHASTRGLQEDLNDFLALVPVDKIQDIFFEYLSEDEDFGEALDYLLSEEFKSLVIEVEGMQEIRNLLNFLQDAGLDAYGLVNKLNQLLGIDEISPLRKLKLNRITGGLPGFIKDVKAVIPLDEIEKLYNSKLETSAEFAELVNRLKSEEAQGLVDKLMSNPKVKDLIKRAEAKGVNVQEILDLITSILGIKFPSIKPRLFATRSLEDDLNDFLALLPLDKIEEIFYEYLSEDEDFGEALDYLLSEEFKSLVIEIEGMKEVRNLLNFLQDAGLDAYGYVNKLNQLLGIDEIFPLRKINVNRISGGLPGFIKDIKAVLPLDEIEKLYNSKLETSTEFAELVNRLKSEEAQGLVNKLMANPKVKDLIKRAEAKGVNVQEILDLITSILGIKFPSVKPVFFVTRGLNEDLNDFLALVPVEKIEEIFYEYLSDDEDFGEALDYLLSEEFKSLVIDIEGMSEVRDLLNFLQESGLDAYGIVNKLNQLLGIDEISPVRKLRLNRITGGLPGFIKDIKAVLPLDEIEKLYNSKLETSSEFAELVNRLKSDKAQGLVDKLMANPKLQDLIKRAEAKGVDVQEILDLITSILGIKFPSIKPVFFRY